MCIFSTLNRSYTVIFFPAHGLISVAVCEMTLIEGKDRVNKEMSMIIKAEIMNALIPFFPSISLYLLLLWFSFIYAFY